MTPELIIERLAADGVRLFLADSGSLKAAGQQEAVLRWLPIIKEHKPGLVAALRAIQPGDNVEWARAGQAQAGIVNFIHTDPDGATWAFVTQGSTWCAVNVKIVKGATA